jgi:hypothetical protein
VSSNILVNFFGRFEDLLLSILCNNFKDLPKYLINIDKPKALARNS